MLNDFSCRPESSQLSSACASDLSLNLNKLFLDNKFPPVNGTDCGHLRAPQIYTFYRFCRSWPSESPCTTEDSQKSEYTAIPSSANPNSERRRKTDQYSLRIHRKRTSSGRQCKPSGHRVHRATNQTHRASTSGAIECQNKTIYHKPGEKKKSFLG